MSRTNVDVAEVIDRIPVGRLQKTVVALCSLVAVLDGFDNLAIALVAPLAARDFQIPVSSFGPVFGAGSFGLMVGALVLGPIADRVGRKPAIVLSLFAIGLFCLLTPLARSFNELLLIRFLSGIGIGGVMPNIIALTSEYSPRRWRATLVTVMFCGIAVGAMLCGLLSARLIGAFGWRSIFYVGALLPALLLFPLLWALPESLRFTVARGRPAQTSLALLRRLDPSGNYGDDTRCVIAGAAARGLPISRLFTEGRALTTPLLWLVFMCNLLVWFFLTTWLPSVLNAANVPLDQAVIATVILYAGGLSGGLLFGRLVDRQMSFGFVSTAYVCAALALAAMAAATGRVGLLALLPLIFAAGFFVNGCQYCINALAANFYPTDLRSTGVGWALGIGRIGSILGPVVGGLLIAAHWQMQHLLLIAGVPALVAAVAAFAISRRERQARSAHALPAGTAQALLPQPTRRAF